LENEIARKECELLHAATEAKGQKDTIQTLSKELRKRSQNLSSFSPIP